MGVLQNSKNKSLLVTDSTNAQAKGRHKGKEPKPSNLKPKENHISFEGSSGSNINKNFKKTRCPYCMRGFHPKNQCMKKQINHLSALLKKNHISLPQRAKNSNGGQSIDGHDRCHVLKSGLFRLTAYLIDFGASNHMVFSKYSFTTLTLTGGASNHMGDDQWGFTC